MLPKLITPLEFEIRFEMGEKTLFEYKLGMIILIFARNFDSWVYLLLHLKLLRILRLIILNSCTVIFIMINSFKVKIFAS